MDESSSYLISVIYVRGRETHHQCGAKDRGNHGIFREMRRVCMYLSMNWIHLSFFNFVSIIKLYQKYQKTPRNSHGLILVFWHRRDLLRMVYQHIVCVGSGLKNTSQIHSSKPTKIFSSKHENQVTCFFSCQTECHGISLDPLSLLHRSCRNGQDSQGLEMTADDMKIPSLKLTVRP